MQKSAGIVIPEDCRFIYIFNNKKDFTDQVESGRMKPLYGLNKSEEQFFQVFVAYIPNPRKDPKP